MMECIICFNDISYNDHFNLICCKNKVHITCLNEWIEKNINKKDISKCFICNQKNDIIQDITSFTRQNVIIDIDETNDITVINNNVSNLIIIRKYLINTCKIIIIVLIILYFVYYLLLL